MLLLPACQGSIIDDVVDIEDCSAPLNVDDLRSSGFIVEKDDEGNYRCLKGNVAIRLRDISFNGNMVVVMDGRDQMRSFETVLDTTVAYNLLRNYRSSLFVHSYPLQKNAELFHSTQLSLIMILRVDTSMVMVRKFL